MQRVRGFTLIELLAVLVITSILAVTAFASLNPRDFDGVRFANEALAQIAYAQKVAVASRRSVRVTVSGNTIALAMCDTEACGATVPVPSPQGEASFVRAAPAGVTIGPDTTFVFNAGGGTGAVTDYVLTINGTVVRTLTVAATTGYVRQNPPF